MVTRSSILAWRIPWTGEPGGVAQSQTRLKRLSTAQRRLRTGRVGAMGLKGNRSKARN